MTAYYRRPGCPAPPRDSLSGRLPGMERTAANGTKHGDSAANANDPKLVALRDKIEVDFQSDWPGTKAELTLELADGRTLEAEYDAGVPESDVRAQGDKIRAKFRALATPVLGESAATKLLTDLDRLESPQYLAMNAEALGMVPNSDPVYLRLSDGAVLGEPTAAGGAAGASASLVPNALIDGVPPVTEQAAEETSGKGGTPEAPPAGTPAAPPALQGGLPTPATH